MERRMADPRETHLVAAWAVSKARLKADLKGVQRAAVREMKSASLLADKTAAQWEVTMEMW